MLKIHGFISESALGSTEVGQLFSGTREEDGKAVLLYVCAPGDSQRENKLRQLYGLLEKLRFKGVVRALELFRAERSLVMAVERFPGESLAEYLKSHRLTAAEVVQMASDLALTLSRVHASRIIHTAIQPSNILVDPDNLAVCLQGFESALPVNRERRGGTRPDLTAEQLPYVSPEQTGRMGREMDFRSDLYSLGITLYELAVGQPPFVAEPMELIHQHLAGTVRPPEQAGAPASFPHQLSRIILKLLEKDPERRYQTARGLYKDLEKLRNQGDDDSAFELGTEEAPDSLLLPTELFGRGDELNQLLRVFKRVCQGTTELVALSGQPGVGKTALVHAFRKHASTQPFVFLKGKFDRYLTSTPYSAIRDALSAWVDQVLIGSDADLGYWKQRLGDSLGNIGQVLMDIVPNLKWVFGDMPQVPRLGSSEARNRIKLALMRCFEAIARPEEPLVLFLDDVQWTDPASLALLEALVLKRPPLPLMIIASFRPSDQSQEREFEALIAKLERDPGDVCTIRMESWSAADANAFIATTLQRGPEETLGLSELVRRKTSNNPLFVRQFLLHAYNLGLIHFIPGQGWDWDAEGIEREGIPDDIVTMMIDKISLLSDQARQVLTLAGCFGNGFTLETLLETSELDENGVALGLYQLTAEGLVSPVGSAYQFTHDRIFEAAQSLLDDAERERIHFAIGIHLLRQEDGFSSSEHVFSITKHLDSCLHLVEDEGDRRHLASLNLVAGRKSIEAAAYPAAERYFRAGLKLMAKATWEQESSLLFELLLGEGESLFRSGKREEAEQRFRELSAYPLHPRPYARLICLRIALFIMTGEVDQAIAAGLEGLAKLQLHIPETPGPRHFLPLILRLRLALLRRSDKALLDSRNCKDELVLAQVAIMVELMVPCYFNDARLAYFFNLVNMGIILKHGHHEHSALVFAMFGLLLGKAWGNMRDRFRFGRLALVCNDRSGRTVISPRVVFIVNAHIYPWIKPLSTSLQPVREVVQQALEMGDLQYASFATLEYISLLIASGEHLSTVQSEAFERANTLRDLGFLTFERACLRLAWFAALLRGDTERLPHRDSDDPFQLDELKDETLRIAYLYAAPFKVISLFYLGHYEEAYELGKSIMSGLMTYIHFSRQAVETSFFLGLSGAHLLTKSPMRDRKPILETLQRSSAKFHDWALHCPANYGAHSNMLQAELARNGPNRQHAWHLYTAALMQAQNENFSHLLGPIHERMASYAEEFGWKALAHQHWRAAQSAYAAWGADAKVRLLQERFGSAATLSDGDFERSLAGEEQRRTIDKGSLDFAAVVESSLAIAQEVSLERVLERLMTSAIENAGAARGVLLLKSEDGLWIEAEGSVSGGFLRIPKLDPLDNTDQLPMTIVRYVQRTLETVVLGEARERGLFKQDPYILEHRARSVLVMPILTQKKFVGILYLENNLVGETFTKERTEVLRVIAAQAAIALQNARLYDELSLLNRELEARVAARTAELRETNRQLTVEVEERIKAEKDRVELQSKLLETARRAGMTEVAIGVLHNVGNVLNSVTISATCLAESFKNTRLGQLDRLVELLAQHREDLAHFLSEDERGKLFPAYLEKLAGVLNKQLLKDSEEVRKLSQHLSHAIEVIRAQQAQANVKAVLEPVDVQELLEQAVKINAVEIDEGDVSVQRDIAPLPTLLIDKHKVLQILINLVKNAVQSLRLVDNRQRELHLGLQRNRDGLTVFSVADNGVGISSEDLSRVFSYGFTTKADGHGFGLHNAANAATEMGGQISVTSPGIGQGACFSLNLPLTESKENHDAVTTIDD